MYHHRSRAATHKGATSHYHMKYSAMELEDELMDSYACNYNFDHGHAASHRQVQTSATASDATADLQMLVTAFPEVDAAIVQDIFIAKNYDVCSTAEALSGLMAPAPVVTAPSDTDDDDDQWSFHDDAEDTASVGSLDWVVVQDDWDVADDGGAHPSCRSYSDVLVAPFAGQGVPFEFFPPAKALRDDAPVVTTHSSNIEKDAFQEVNDYYSIKEYGQRRAHHDRLHPRKTKAAKAPSTKKGK
ncbi:hypothetical protein SDRG_04293 [Saprolegnia diclina VS20]|uniref:CUE domain-containing protein n=1 Tax=Saprolegnia diclina (strain VS20) TaxID=1156394 RepID=T0QX30_SAPDV|nr:hypothetical protein SDRG_04293 [Saprolegnia diclina VS20]EQC38590.1 hypothetical protein SDRG_04293 [Saprolegnia diclina VS20]|eukprot:XP_008608182.1 hypothetical protein SDRG_04293 [Saprolegnia diclina VS20]